jgi:hypothetical protein
MVEDFLYSGTDFREDPDLVLPEGAAWGDLGEKKTLVFLVLYIIIFFDAVLTNM